MSPTLLTSEHLVRVDTTAQIKSHPLLPNFQQQYETFSMIRFLVFLIWLLCIPISAIADVLEDASKFTVRVRTSIEYSFAEDDAGTGKAAAFIVDAINWGAHTITLPSGMLFDAATAPTFTAAGTDKLAILKDKDEVFSMFIIGQAIA